MFQSETIAKGLLAMLRDGHKPVDVAQYLESFAAENRIQAQIPTIVRYLDVLGAEEATRTTLTIIGGNKLSKKNLDDIRAVAGATPETHIEISTDRDLMGGFIATYNNVRYDGSVKGQLEKLEQSLIQ